mgnify:CR=1 FL=1
MSDVPPPPPPPPPPPSYGAGPPGASPNVGAALSYGFNKYFANFGAVILIILVAFAAQIAVQILDIAVSSFFLKAVFGIIGFVVSAAVSIGIYRAALMLTAGVQPTVSTAPTTTAR